MSEHLKRLKELRLTKGISQKEIAEHLGITARAIFYTLNRYFPLPKSFTASFHHCLPKRF